MSDIRKHSSTSNLVRFLLTKSTDGTAFTGASSASSGLIISTIADNEQTATAYTVAGSTIETITTLGTFAAPTATKCRFKEVDATNHPGFYEFQFADARYAVANAKRFVITVSGVSGMFSCDYEIQLVQVDVYDAVRLGLTALPNVIVSTVGGLLTAPTTANVGTVDLVRILGTLLTETSGQIAAGFKKLFDVAAPVFTLLSANQTADNNTKLADLQARVPAALTANGNMKSSVLEFITTAITEGAVGRIAAAWQGFWNVATPTGTVNSLPSAVPGNSAGLPRVSDVPTTAQMEAAILNEGDATALLAAISAKVEEFLINDGDATATIAAIAAACNAAVVAGTVGSNVTAILLGTGTTIPAQISALNNITAASVVTAMGTGTFLSAIPWNAAWDAEVQSEVQDAIEVNHLDHLLAADYDPASKPGVSTALLNELIGSDAGVSQFTANALELGLPSLRSSLTLAQAVDLILAAGIGVSSTPSSTTEKFKFLDAVDAFTTTFDSNGNRTGVVLH